MRRVEHPSEIEGLSASTCHALNRLDRERLRPDAIKACLAYWQWLSEASREELALTFDSPPDEMWPGNRDEARGALEDAVHALPRQAARQLRALVETIDQVILARTAPAYYKLGCQFWWQGRTLSY